MKRTLVTYYTQTGNTRKVAEAIAEVLSGRKELKPMEEVSDFSEHSLVFAGFPVQSHSVPYKAEAFLKKLPPGIKIALFCTHGSLSGSSLSREAIEYALTLVSKAKVLGTFACRGKVSITALELLMKSPEHEAWAAMAASASTHPDESDLEDARAFARWVVTVAAHH